MVTKAPAKASKALAKGTARAKDTGKPAVKPNGKPTGKQTGKSTGLGAEVGLSDADLLEMYRMMVITRQLDERMWVLNRAGKVPFVISGQGHEGAQVAITRNLRVGHDWFVPYYRSIAAVMTFGMTPREIMLAQFAKAVDPSSGGRQMPGHYGAAHHNILSTSSPVGTQILHAVGIAMAAKIRGTDQVAMTSMGEGASNQGDVHEGLNFAAIQKLPVVLMIENNGYAISVPARLEVSIENVADRASAYGIAGVVVDGGDVLACYKAGKEAVDRARSGGGPTILEAKVLRLTAHSSDDQQTKYRPSEELAEEKARDPVPRFKGQLMDAGVLDEEKDAAFIAEAKEIIDDATDWAEAQPDPDPGKALQGVYATGEPGAAAGSTTGAVAEPGRGGQAAGPGGSDESWESGSAATERIEAAFDEGKT
jgi:2-oxoisovalerate dehydrogenase E1 component alpha subunit